MSKEREMWTTIAKDMLVGRKITKVRYLSKEEMNDVGWYASCVVLQLDDGNIIFPSSDDEGNSAGALFTNNEENPVLPVISNNTVRLGRAI